MKKILFLAGAVFLFTGCVNSQQNIKPISMKSVSLLDKYGVNEKALIPVNDGYIFVIPAAGGADIYKLNKNYNLVWKKSTPILIDPIKYEIKNNTLYILGYDQNKNKVALLEYDLKGNVKKINYYGKKFDLARDFLILNKNTYVAVTQYTPNNNSDIVIYSNNNKITFSTPYMDDVKFIKPFKKGILIIGTIQGKSEDVIIAYKTLDNKTVWAKEIDMGMDEKPLKVEIKNNEITLKVLSTDNMGAEKEATFIIDEKGNIKSVKKGIEFEQLPMKYRT
jgi:hypothetical protein